MSTSLREANKLRQAEWDPENKVSLTYRGNELAGEVGEACNIIKKLERERLGIRGSRVTKEQLAGELADVVICADLIAMAEEIDLDAAVRDKFNLTSIKYNLSTRLAAVGEHMEVSDKDTHGGKLRLITCSCGWSVNDTWNVARQAYESHRTDEAKKKPPPDAKADAAEEDYNPYKKIAALELEAAKAERVTEAMENSGAEWKPTPEDADKALIARLRAPQDADATYPTLNHRLWRLCQEAAACLEAAEDQVKQLRRALLDAEALMTGAMKGFFKHWHERRERVSAALEKTEKEPR